MAAGAASQQSPTYNLNNMKKLSKEPKRSESPVNPKTMDMSSRRKKPSFHSGIAELDGTQNRSERKKSLLSKESGHTYQNIKDRIVTEPVDNFDRIQHLVKGSFVNNSSFTKLQLDRKKTELAQSSEKKIKIHIKNPMQPLKAHERQGSPQVECHNCARSRELQAKMAAQLESVRNEIQRVLYWKESWKNGKATLEEVQKEFLNRHRDSNTLASRSSLDNVSLKRSVREIKAVVIELMEDIQNLAQFDFKKMIKSEIFTYDAFSPAATDRKILEAKAIVDQMKNAYFGSASTEPYSLVDIENEHSFLMLRNMKCRLNQALRENLELKVKSKILSKASEIVGANEGELHRIIQDVIEGY